MADVQTFEVALIGPNLRPGTVSARDVGRLIIKFEAMLASMVNRLPSTSPQREEKVVFGLVSIESGSYSMIFEVSETLVGDAYRRLAKAVATEQYADLPQDVLEGLQTVVKYTQERNCIIEMAARQNGSREVLAELTPETRVEVLPLVSGTTHLYGYVIEVGREKPRVVIESHRGKVTCLFSPEIPQEEARHMNKQIARYLYDKIGLLGKARWNRETLTIEEFYIRSILPYRGGSLLETMDKLRQSVGRYFDAIDDPVEYVRRLRSGDILFLED